MTEPTMKEVQEHFLSLLDDNHRRHWEYRIVHPKLPLPGTRQAQENAAMTKWETQATRYTGSKPRRDLFMPTHEVCVRWKDGPSETLLLMRGANRAAFTEATWYARRYSHWHFAENGQLWFDSEPLHNQRFELAQWRELGELHWVYMEAAQRMTIPQLREYLLRACKMRGFTSKELLDRTGRHPTMMRRVRTLLHLFVKSGQMKYTPLRLSASGTYRTVCDTYVYNIDEWYEGRWHNCEVRWTEEEALAALPEFRKNAPEGTFRVERVLDTGYAWDGVMPRRFK